MADAAELDFATWLEGVRTEEITRGISAGTVDVALANVAPIPRVIELDQRPPELTSSFTAYLERVAPPSRVEAGWRMLALNRELLEAVWRRYGVPLHVAVALWGMEIEFGRRMGQAPGHQRLGHPCA
jgi:membrane-bound lytic murein transglycosylase B